MLTDAHCWAAKPRDKLYRINDARGLYLEVKPNGVRAWRYRFKLSGKASWFALGDYPDTSLANARDKCNDDRGFTRTSVNSKSP
ncbi:MULTISPECIES: Arm DNA-binding domain-containing protein [unclassified Halomonas]|uniref:Arm DNA-binding domain-containing protein n=1 Tax=Halomonas sp. N3-2A TaxID=2014541 RepID=UPI000B5B4664|nr:MULTISPECIES: Arm DNA-binding domain-containing protein [unclassified Halomonas]ASK19341.1 integrase [Halomonas sp. N3-2A]UTD54157.1 Arm DNA-binding domain-containing protein [Halomonas sp. MS1]